MTPDEELAFEEMAKTIVQRGHEVRGLIALLSALVGILRAKKILDSDDIETMVAVIEDRLPGESWEAYQDLVSLMRKLS